MIVVANLSCNSSRTVGPRTEIIENLRAQDPDVLFFGGDQTYRHTEHTAGWIEFGLQFRDIIRDRPTVCIPDDHDVGMVICGARPEISRTFQVMPMVAIVIPLLCQPSAETTELASARLA